MNTKLLGSGLQLAFQNGMAILNACTVLRDRLKPYRERMPDKNWDDWVGRAYFERVPLFASGFYATPGV